MSLVFRHSHVSSKSFTAKASFCYYESALQKSSSALFSGGIPSILFFRNLLIYINRLPKNIVAHIP